MFEPKSLSTHLPSHRNDCVKYLKGMDHLILAVVGWGDVHGDGDDDDDDGGVSNLQENSIILLSNKTFFGSDGRLLSFGRCCFVLCCRS